MTSEHESQPESHDTKLKTSVSLSLWLVEWMDEQIKNKKFASRSGAIEIALAEMKGRNEEREKIIKEAETKKIEVENSKGAENPEYDKAIALVLKLLLRHPELMDEINTLIKQSRDTKGFTKEVKFDL